MEPPELSVIVLTYDRPQLLQSCLESLAAQTYPAERFEVVVADDGSGPETAATVERHAQGHPNVRHVRHAHRGIPATRNLGLRHARGALVAIVADDYILDPEYVATAVRFFAEHGDASVLRCGITAAGHDLGSRISNAYYRASILRRLVDVSDNAGVGQTTWLPVPPKTVTTRHALEASGAAIFRRAVFDRVGEFDETLARAEDSDLTVRLRQSGIAVHYLPRDLIRHQYDRYLRDTLMKSWHTGWYRYRYYRKNELAAAGAGKLLPALVRGKLRGVLAMIGEGRSEGSLARVLLALPFVALFELVNKSGFVCSWLWSRRRPGAK